MLLRFDSPPNEPSYDNLLSSLTIFILFNPSGTISSYQVHVNCIVFGQTLTSTFFAVFLLNTDITHLFRARLDIDANV